MCTCVRVHMCERTRVCMYIHACAHACMRITRMRGGCRCHQAICMHACSLARLLACSLARLLACSLARLHACSLARLLACSLARLLACSLARSLACSIARLLARSLARLHACMRACVHMYRASAEVIGGIRWGPRLRNRSRGGSDTLEVTLEGLELRLHALELCSSQAGGALDARRRGCRAAARGP